eukprot:444258-Amphidinium_carterae.2
MTNSTLSVLFSSSSVMGRKAGAIAELALLLTRAQPCPAIQVCTGGSLFSPSPSDVGKWLHGFAVRKWYPV